MFHFQVERDEALYKAGFSLPLFDPRRLLGCRDPMIDEAKRAAVPSSFASCASGPSCRSQDRLTLSISRNRLCAQCCRRFCSKCMEETSLLESRSTAAKLVCFACFGEQEQERQMLLALQRSNKFSDESPESSEEMACRHVLRLAGSIALATRSFQHYPFVRSSGSRFQANLLFVPEALVPLDFCWESTGSDLVLHLPFAASVRRVELIAPPSGWWDEGEQNKAVVEAELRGSVSGKALSVLLLRRDAQRVVANVTDAPFESELLFCCPARLRVARMILELGGQEKVALADHAGVDEASAEEKHHHNSFEIFGKKSSSSMSASSRVTTELVQDVLTPLKQRLVEPFKRELRHGNTVDIWLVKQRNSVDFAGGFAVRLGREEQPQQMSIRVHSMRLDEKGDYHSSQSLGLFVLPTVPTVSVVWFALPLLHRTSCIILEVICPTGAPVQQLWLTSSQ